MTKALEAFRVVDNLESAITGLLECLDDLVVVEASPHYPGCLVFQPGNGDHQGFLHDYGDWVSRYLLLGQLFALESFVRTLEDDGKTVLFGPSAAPVLDAYTCYSEPLQIEGYDLHPFQQFTLRRAFERDYWFFNWATGSGKSRIAAPAGAKELFARGEIDVIVACTIPKSKLDLCGYFREAGLDAVVNDGTKVRRRKVYAQNHQVYVANYEKLSFDREEIGALTAGRRVLWIFDEAHRLICDTTNGATYNKARRAFEVLHKGCAVVKVWPMGASVPDGNPLRFRDVFNLDGGRQNPLGTKTDFLRRYADGVAVIDKTTPTGKIFTLTYPNWNLARLKEVPHRVTDRTTAVRKTDPWIRTYFKGVKPDLVSVQLNAEDRELHDLITELAWDAWIEDPSISLGPYYRLLRYVCNTPRAVARSDDEVGRQITAQYPKLLDPRRIPAKLEKLNEQLESIREGGDKVLVFTCWTELTLHLIKDLIGVPHVTHWGVGQSDRESQRVKEQFRDDPDITCFLTSDAGSHGLNMQCARYVIQYEPTYSYDLSMQRASRIDRADSHLDGLTNYVYCTENSVEERVLSMQEDRRCLSEAVQGTSEALSPIDLERAQLSEADNYRWLLFGDRL